MSDMPRDIWAYDCTGLPSGAWGTTKDSTDSEQYTNTAQLIEAIEGMKVDLKQVRFGGVRNSDVGRNAALDDVIKLLLHSTR